MAKAKPKKAKVAGERLEVQRFGSLVYFHKFTPGKGWTTTSKWEREKPSRKKR